MYLLSVVFIRCTTHCQSLLLIVICCHSLWIFVTHCHFFNNRCTIRCHSLSFVGIHDLKKLSSAKFHRAWTRNWRTWWPSANSLFNCHNPKGIKFITRLRLGLSHLREHKFKHSFQDSLNPFCSCSLDIESTAHFLLHCPTYTIERRTLLSTIENIDNNLLDLGERVLIRTPLFGSNSFDTYTNTNVLNAIIEYILSTKRFDEPLFQWKQKIFKQCYESVHSVFFVFTYIRVPIQF